MATFLKISPKNYLGDWGEFESWSQGTSTNPDGWLSTSSPLLAQETSNIKFGSYSARVVGSGALGGITRTIPDGSSYAGRTFTLGVWAKSASTGPYIQLSDGVALKTVHLDGLNALSFVSTPAMKLDFSATKIQVDFIASTGSTAYFDSAILCEGESLFTSFDTNIDIVSYKPNLNMKQDQYEMSQNEGSFIPDNHIQSKTISFSGQVVGSDSSSTQTNFNSLMKSLLSNRTTEKRDLHLLDGKVVEVFLKSFNHNYVPGVNMIKIDGQFVNPDGTSRFINKYRTRQVISGSVTEFNLTYNGNAETKPLISFIANQGGAITTCTLKNLTTSETIGYTGTVPTNVALDIDCSQGTVFNSSINSIQSFGTSDFIRLVRGTNYFRFSGSNCTINIDYYERFL